MNCRSCGADARDGLRFCEACGETLEQKCRGCGAPAPLQARFCGVCGAAFAFEPTAPASSEGERRQLTVLFADVVGATTLSGRLDPEALRELLLAYQRVCVECVDRYGGNVHQYVGDGVLAYFGYPAAHDDDAERAVRAGLDIVDAVRQLAADLRQRGEAAIAVRIGIHTGMVVVGEMGAGDVREVHAIGETPNVAARVQAEASPDSVCISAATLRLVNQRFQTRSLGLRPLKGVANELELFAVDAAHTATDEDRTRLTSPLIGREKELAHLEERWASARSGHGQAVLISGEGGIGKSRLLSAFRERAGGAELAWRNIRCSPFYQNSALQPMIDLIERAIGRAGGDSASDRRDALRRALEDAGLADEMTFALIASLVGLGAEHQTSLQDLAPQQRKSRTQDALISWFRADAQKTPLVVAVEDLHWIDASTRDLLGILLERIVDLPILLVLTFRPEFVPAWTLHGQISMLPISRLTSEQCALLALGVIGGKGLPAHVVEEVVRRTDGVPLFVEELTKAIVDADTADEVPASLRDSLTARLDRLGEAKLVAQLASVLGREFDYAILHAICDLSQAALEQKLAALNRAEIIRQSGMPPRSRYVFKHALIQEAAYDTLLKSARARVHRRAAEAYVNEFPDLAHSRPELVAHHFSRASLPARAIEHWQRAGEVAVSRSGYSEAIGHLGAALEQLALLPESPERMTTELALRVKIGPALQAIKGTSAPEATDNYERACQIAELLGDSPERFMALWGDWFAKTTGGRTLEGARRSDDLVALSRRLDHEDYLLQAHHSRWTNYFHLGDARICRADTLVGMRLYDRVRHRHHRHVYGGHDPGVCAFAVGANAAWLSGYADEALELANQAIAISKEIEHPFSQSLAWLWSTYAIYFTWDHALARERAEILLQLCDSHGFRNWTPQAMLVSGASSVFAGETGVGLELMEKGIFEGYQAGYVNNFFYALSAAAHRHCGNLGRSLELLTEAIDRYGKRGADILRPEVDRLHAEVLLLMGQIDTAQAITRIEAAAELAGRQGALALEWRAAMSLARLYSSVGRDDQARDLLRANYARFTEGFASPDLVEGKQLLDDLG